MRVKICGLRSRAEIGAAADAGATYVGLVFFPPSPRHLTLADARWVVQGAPALGLALGLGTMMTGLTLVAIGTALPEIVLAVLAAQSRQGNIVLGHVLGASIFNLLFVVGGMALAKPLAIPASFVHFELPAAMAFALLLFPILAGDLRASRREGAVLIAGFFAWLAFELYTALH